MIRQDLAVVDASVVLKGQLNDEECITQARAVRDDFYGFRVPRVIVPALLFYELANALATSVRRKRIPPAFGNEALSRLMALGVEVREISFARVLGLALEYDLSSYDTAYVAVAAAGSCGTGDRRLYHAIAAKPAWVRGSGIIGAGYDFQGAPWPRLSKTIPTNWK